MRSFVPYPESPRGAGRSPIGGRSLRSPFHRGLRAVLPCVLHLIALLLIASPVLPDVGAFGHAPFSMGPVFFEANEAPAPDDALRMARSANDADDLREAFAVPSPRLAPAVMVVAAFDHLGTDRPDTRTDHPPDRPPRRIA